MYPFHPSLALLYIGENRSILEKENLCGNLFYFFFKLCIIWCRVVGILLLFLLYIILKEGEGEDIPIVDKILSYIGILPTSPT